jgi:E3 ubiquitin-protein ligase DOA10
VALDASFQHRIDNSVTNRATFVQANNNLVAAFNTFATAQQHCETTSGAIPCLEQVNHTLSVELTHFANAIAGQTSPDVSQSVVDRSTSDARALAAATAKVAQAGPSKNAYQYTVVAEGVNKDFARMTTDLNQLRNQLNASQF